MKTVIPDYFDQFKCIADKCRHTCCVGWEIDVDESTLKRYEPVSGPLGDKLQKNIVRDECPHFRLTSDERCPFLNEQNLCELILNLGKDSLCQICADHPRFRNYFSDRTEMGLGLCCEAAAALILGRREPMVLLTRSDDQPEEPLDSLEQAILAVRKRAFEIIQDRNRPMTERIEALLAEFDVRLPQKTAAEWADYFLSLERLDHSWDEQLNKLKSSSAPSAELSDLEIPLEQLAVYFLYRHLPAAQDATDIRACLGFAVLSWRLIRQLCRIQQQNGGCSLPDLVEFARLYSSEIEYCEENTDAILNLLWDENA